MQENRRKRLIIAVVGVTAVVLGFVAYASKTFTSVEREIDGRIVELDANARTASLEIVHPKSGQLIVVDGKAGPQCEVTVDGKAASLDDLRIGDRAHVRARITPDMHITALAVHVTRPEIDAPTAPVEASANGTRS